MRPLFSTFLLFFCLVNHSASAQGGTFVPGSYITVTGDTVSGFIKDNISLEFSEGIRFKPAEGAQATFVPANVLESFQFGENNRYRTYQIENLLRFLKTVVEAPAGLLRGFIPGSGEVYFVREAGVWTLGGGLLRIDQQTKETAIETLREACPELPAGDSIRYSHQAMIGLVRQYNACRYPGEPVQVLEEKRRLVFAFGVKPFWYWGSMHLGEGNYYNNGDFDETYSGFSGALVMQLKLTRSFSIFAEVGYLHQEMRADSINVYPLEVPETFSKVAIKLDYLEVPLTIQYAFPLGGFRPYAEAGLYLGIPISRNVEDELTLADPDHARFKPDNQFDGWNLGFIGGVGAGVPLGGRWRAQILFRYAPLNTRMESLTPAFSNQPLFSDLKSDRIEVGVRLMRH